MNSLLNGKVAIVTGAGRGLGAEIARLLASNGAKVAVNDLNPDRAERVVGEIVAAGGEAIAIVADIGNKFQCVHLVEMTRDKLGGVDILVNNAAVQPKSTLIKLDEWDWDRCLEINLKGTFMMTQLVGRVMQMEATGGAIVNISSTAGIDVPFENRAAYCASKAGIVGLARECAREYAQFNVRVNTLLPDETAECPTIAQAVLPLVSPTSDVTGTTVTINAPS